MLRRRRERLRVDGPGGLAGRDRRDLRLRVDDRGAGGVDRLRLARVQRGVPGVGRPQVLRCRCCAWAAAWAVEACMSAGCALGRRRGDRQAASVAAMVRWMFTAGLLRGSGGWAVEATIPARACSPLAIRQPHVPLIGYAARHPAGRAERRSRARRRGRPGVPAGAASAGRPGRRAGRAARDRQLTPEPRVPRHGARPPVPRRQGRGPGRDGKPRSCSACTAPGTPGSRRSCRRSSSPILDGESSSSSHRPRPETSRATMPVGGSRVRSRAMPGAGWRRCTGRLVPSCTDSGRPGIGALRCGCTFPTWTRSTR